MANIKEALNQAVLELKNLQTDVRFRRQYPEWVPEIAHDLQYLEQLLGAQSDIKRLRTERDQDASVGSESKLDRGLHEFFKLREAYLKAGRLVSFADRVNPLNQIFERLAKQLAGPQESVLKILFPGIQVDYYCYSDENLKFLTEDKDRNLRHHHFILNHDCTAIIPLPEWFKMQGSGNEDSSFLNHMYAKSPQGIYTKQDQDSGVQPEYLPLREEELDELKTSAGSASVKFFEELKIRKSFAPLFFLEALNQLKIDLKEHGFGKGKKDSQGVATSTNAHPALYPKIATFFEKGWNPLDEQIKSELLRLEEWPHSFKDCILVLRAAGGYVLTEEEAHQLKNEQKVLCVESLESILEQIVTKNIRTRSLKEFQKEFCDYFNQSLSKAVPMIGSKKYSRGYHIEAYAALLEGKNFDGKASHLPVYLELNDEDRLFSEVNLREVMVYALSQKNESLILRCLKRGFPVNDRVDDKGNSILHLSIRESLSRVFDYILSLNPDLNLPNHQGLPPVLLSVLKKNHHYFDSLIARQVKYDFILPDGETILSVALGRAETAIINKILQLPGVKALVNIENHYGLTPIYKVENFYYPSYGVLVAIALIKLGAVFDPVKIYKNMIAYPVYYVTSDPIDLYDLVELLRYCIEAGLDVETRYEGKTFFQFCASEYDPQILTFPELMKLCLEKKKHFNGVDEKGKTDQDYLKDTKDRRIMQMAVDQGFIEQPQTPASSQAPVTFRYQARNYPSPSPGLHQQRDLCHLM